MQTQGPTREKIAWSGRSSNLVSGCNIPKDGAQSVAPGVVLLYPHS